MKQPYRNPDKSEACANSREEGFKDGITKSALKLSNWRIVVVALLISIPLITWVSYTTGKAYGHERKEEACTDEAWNLYSHDHATCTHSHVPSSINGNMLYCLCPGESFAK